ncbi:hypothetical protein [Jiangella mangrovi]|uniref:Uncharacterized protein n=1 Tax=Jiangella mangrovi TaxID=1524084 RepID=A0A7W9LP15_9ACTN|nr:hypothetical protein [Jiangella mangrovi]MBB5790829.1 hypothetical protein [Jiangella mangrovi]
MFGENRRAPGRHDRDDADEIIDRCIEAADGVTLRVVDHVHVQVRPDELGPTYLEAEFDELARELLPLHAERGERRARRHRARVARYEARAVAARARVADLAESARAATTARAQALTVLGPLTRREPHAKFWYVLRWLLLVVGDVAGIAGAAILLGELVELALMQAVATGIAAVTAGLVGQDLRDLVLARRRHRDLDELTAEELRFARLFTAPRARDAVVKVMAGVAVTIALLTAGGIFVLRSNVEGTDNGIIFGCLAVAICCASAINSYVYADEVADLLDRAELAQRRATRRHARAARSRAIRRHAEAMALADSITTEELQRGAAAAAHVRVLKWRILRQNPAVVGHGPRRSRPLANGSDVTARAATPPATRNGARR